MFYGVMASHIIFLFTASLRKRFMASRMKAQLRVILTMTRTTTLPPIWLGGRMKKTWRTVCETGKWLVEAQTAKRA